MFKNALLCFVIFFSFTSVAMVHKSMAEPSLEPLFTRLSALQSVKSLPLDPHCFALTTEAEIGKIEPLLANVPAGIFVSVGGDRAFRGAALMKGIQGIVIFDRDPRVITFNQINAKLLKADDLPTYLHLRWEADFNEWKDFDSSLTETEFRFWHMIMNTKTLSEQLNRVESDGIIDNFNNLYKKKFESGLDDQEQQWYENVLATNRCVQLFIKDPKNNKLVNPASFIRYKQRNYLFDEELFQRLRNLARANKILSVEIDLSNQAAQETIISAFRESSTPISVLDLDNAYKSGYIGEQAYQRLINRLLPSGTNKSLLLAMDNMHSQLRYQATQACWLDYYNVYLGFTFEYLRRFSAVTGEEALKKIFGQSKSAFDHRWQDIKLLRLKKKPYKVIYSIKGQKIR